MELQNSHVFEKCSNFILKFHTQLNCATLDVSIIYKRVTDLRQGTEEAETKRTLSY